MPVCTATGSTRYIANAQVFISITDIEQVHESDFFLGREYGRKNYVWGKAKEDGSRHVHTLRTGPTLYGSDHHYHPREFKLIGFLAHGLECDLGDLSSLARFEPTALLVPGSEYSLQAKQQRVLDVCRELEAGTVQPGVEQIASLTRDGGVVLTFPKILDVSDRYCYAFTGLTDMF